MKRMNVAKRLVALLLIGLLVSGLLGGCAKKASEAGSAADGAPTASVGKTEMTKTENEGSQASPGMTDTTTSGETGNGGKNNKAIFGGHKIIQSGELYIETLDFDKTINDLFVFVESVGGFVQSEDVQGSGYYSARDLRTGNYVFRVPYEKFSLMFKKAGDFGYIRSQARHGEDITDQYFDTETKLSTLKIRQERLQSLMKKATKLADIIEIERELQNVAYEIDSLTGSLKKWDSLVSYATISVQVQEVVEPTKEEPSQKAGLGARMLYSLKDSLEGLKDGFQAFMIILMYILPYLLLFGVVAFIALKMKRRFKRARKTEEKEERIDKVQE